MAAVTYTLSGALSDVSGGVGGSNSPFTISGTVVLDPLASSGAAPVSTVVLTGATGFVRSLSVASYAGVIGTLFLPALVLGDGSMNDPQLRFNGIPGLANPVNAALGVYSGAGGGATYEGVVSWH